MTKTLRGIAGLGLAALALSIVPAQVQAQLHTVEVTPLVGYLFGGKVKGTSAEYEIPSAMSYGGQIAFKVRPGGWVEFTYVRQDSEANLNEYGTPNQEKLFDLGANYFFLGGRQEGPRSGPAIPFFNFSLGTSNFSPKTDTVTDGNNYQSIWKFAFMGGVGIKVPLGRSVMFNTQFRGYATTLWGGTGFWCGFGGCSIGVSGNAMFQGDIMAGLTIPLGG